VFALAVLALADSVSFMVVMPSLSFYVDSLQGSQDFYGLVLALYSFFSFIGKPILGRWSDVSNFQTPYMASISLSVLGSILYTIAPVFSSAQTGLLVLALGRIVGGCGRANSALGFAYIAKASPPNQRTSTAAILGSVQMIGMAIAPCFSAFIQDVDFDVAGLHFNNLNTVGLIMTVINLVSQIVIYIMLPNLSDDDDNNGDDDNDDEKTSKESQWMRIFRVIFSNPHVGVPFLTIFVFNFNFQFIEVSIAPAAFDALNWTPVEVSSVLGMMAVMVFVGMTSVHRLSSRGTSDYVLLTVGLLGNFIGYLLLYLFWFRGVHYAAFVGPVFLGAVSFAFLGAPNRSIFTEAVDLESDLKGYEGTMQALLSMASSFGGFTAPFFITHYCLRSPEEVTASSGGLEFTPLALLSPALGLAVLIMSLLAGAPAHLEREESADEETQNDTRDGVDEETPDEATKLLHDDPVRPKLRRRTIECKSRRQLLEDARGASFRGSMMGITIVDDGFES